MAAHPTAEQLVEVSWWFMRARAISGGPPMPDADDDELERTYHRTDVQTIVYGHIHRPFVRRAGARLLVVNAGSAGLPWDGDPRGSYVLIEHGKAEIVRVEYDTERDAALLTNSGHPDARRLAEMRRRGRFIPPA